MPFAEELHSTLAKIDASQNDASGLINRFRTEVEFAKQLVAHKGGTKTKEWNGLILQAVEHVESKLSGNGAVNLKSIIKQAEEIMAPIGKAAKEYTLFCAGHAHIDMNWLWPWQETVACAHDTFATVDRLMDEFPTFHFSQSQASTYVAMEDYVPEIFEMIKKRIAEGRWEPTASMWVEGDKNMASGEILCRHLLYTRRYFKEKFGLPYDAIKLDWEPDTFGHAHTLPGILVKGGVKWYYFCRCGKEPQLFWWEAPDGSRVLAFNDKLWYNGVITPDMTSRVFEFEKQTGLKEYLFLYGVGDHGGGPTRKDLRAALDMDTWPIYPNVKLTTMADFYSTIEKKLPKNLPVINDELNFTFPGCYTSQSNVKRGNRESENMLPEAELAALIGGSIAGMDYPSDMLYRGWQHAMFNQFHDILPGSGIHATYEYAQGLYQEIRAITEQVTTRSLRKLAAAVNTSAVAGPVPEKGAPGSTIGDGIGAGAGDPSIPGAISARNAGAVGAEPVMVYNPMPFSRSEMVLAKVWNKEYPGDRIAVIDEKGNRIAGQLIQKAGYWGHTFHTVAFPAKDVPAGGYKVYAIDTCVEPIPAEGARVIDGRILENEYLRAEIEFGSGAIVHLIDKATGFDFVPEGGKLGLLEIFHEIPHGMTAWEIGQIDKVTRLTEGATVHQAHGGPHRAAVHVTHKYGDSKLDLEITLDAGSRKLEFSLSTLWVERGTPETGNPMLRIAFPLNAADTIGTYEIPFGNIKRPANGAEVPALKWADLSGKNAQGKEVGYTLVNKDKYGHNADGNTLRLTLLRSSYDPDPLPEMNRHNIQFALIPHMGACNVSEATKAGWAFNHPMNMVSTDVHKGELPAEMSFIESLSANVMISGVKKAEDADAVIIRLWEMEGKATEAKIKVNTIVKPGSKVETVDLLEQPVEGKAKMTGDTITVKIPAHAIVSVKVG